MILLTSITEIRSSSPMFKSGKCVKKRTPLIEISLVPACARITRRSLRSETVRLTRV